MPGWWNAVRKWRLDDWRLSGQYTPGADNFEIRILQKALMRKLHRRRSPHRMVVIRYGVWQQGCLADFESAASAFELARCNIQINNKSENTAGRRH